MPYPTWSTNEDLGSTASGNAAVVYTLTAVGSTSLTVLSNTIPSSSVVLTSTTAVITFDAPYVVADADYSIIIRATNTSGVTDRTFSLTVLAAPGITWTQNEVLPSWVIGSRREISLTADWSDPIEYVLLAGKLPTGVYLDNSGVLYGIAGSNLVANSLVSDRWVVSSTPTAVPDTYEFTVRARSVADTTIYVDKTFTLNTIETDGYDASSTLITVDTTELSVDLDSDLSIVLLTSPALGTYRHNNQFLKQIRAWNPTGEDLEYQLMGEQNGYDDAGYDQDTPIDLSYDGYQATTAPYLQVELRNGYVTGQIPNINYQQEYNSFSVEISKVLSTVTTQDKLRPEFTFTVIGNEGIDYQFVDSNGNAILDTATYRYSLRKGTVSDLSINCYQVQNPNTPLFFELHNGQLPPGLTLTPRGYLSGQVSWLADESIYSFQVKVYNPSQDASELSPLTVQIQTFEIEVLPFMSGATEVTQAFNIFYRAYMKNSDRTVWRNLITDQRIFNNSIVYRAEDREFGRQLECEFLAFVGIAEYEAEQFANAVSQNWDLKRFRLGNLHVAAVKDSNRGHICDAVYVDIIDPQLNSVMKGPPQIVAIPATDDLFASVEEIYPATLQNQLERLQDEPGQATDSLLPRWMSSPQADGRPLGWVSAAVLCYVAPGGGAQVLRKIRTSTHKLSQIDFHVDRMVLKGALTNGTVFDDGETVFSYTSFDIATTEDKYIYFNTDGAIYDINN